MFNELIVAKHIQVKTFPHPPWGKNRSLIEEGISALLCWYEHLLYQSCFALCPDELWRKDT